MKFGLSEHAINLIQNVFRRYSEISQVKIFGSRALGSYRDNSDIDLVLWGNIDESLYAKLNSELDELPLPYIFDVQLYADITQVNLREHIDQFAKIIYEREKA